MPKPRRGRRAAERRHPTRIRPLHRHINRRIQPLPPTRLHPRKPQRPRRLHQLRSRPRRRRSIRHRHPHQRESAHQPTILREICEINEGMTKTSHQPTYSNRDYSDQTLRMAATIMTNAFVFQLSLVRQIRDSRATTTRQSLVNRSPARLPDTVVPDLGSQLLVDFPNRRGFAQRDLYAPAIQVCVEDHGANG